MSRVRVVVPARNEASRLGQCLQALLSSVQQARMADRRIDIIVVVDRSDDDTAAIARRFDVRVVDCPPPYGKVEALRAGLAGDDHDDDDGGAMAIFVGVDADVVVGPRTIGDLLAALESNPELLAACPPLQPLPPVRRTPLSWALYRYNRQRGFSSERRWLNGRCWASRPFTFPTPAAMARRADDVGLDADHPLRGPLVADDVWLSRHLVDLGGEGAIAVVDTDPVLFRPPATLQGMARYWRRLRRELWRIDVLFPELPRPAARQPDLLAAAPFLDRLAWWIFQGALAWCRFQHNDDGNDNDNDNDRDDPWPVVVESKAP